MDYLGLTADDLANTAALNRAFLETVSGARGGAFAPIGTRELSAAEVSRLADVPFLLFSVRERDEEYWQPLFADHPQLILMDRDDQVHRQLREITVAGLGFLWELARRNPYAVRLVCGASVAWCERLAELTLVTVVQRVSRRRDLLCLRFADDEAVWRRLLAIGKAEGKQGRLAAHHFALQSLLTHRRTPVAGRLSAAACKLRVPGRQMAPNRSAGIPESEV